MADILQNIFGQRVGMVYEESDLKEELKSILNLTIGVDQRILVDVTREAKRETIKNDIHSGKEISITDLLCMYTNCSYIIKDGADIDSMVDLRTAVDYYEERIGTSVKRWHPSDISNLMGSISAYIPLIYNGKGDNATHTLGLCLATLKCISKYHPDLNDLLFVTLSTSRRSQEILSVIDDILMIMVDGGRTDLVSIFGNPLMPEDNFSTISENLGWFIEYAYEITKDRIDQIEIINFLRRNEDKNIQINNKVAPYWVNIVKTCETENLGMVLEVLFKKDNPYANSNATVLRSVLRNDDEISEPEMQDRINYCCSLSKLMNLSFDFSSLIKD